MVKSFKLLHCIGALGGVGGRPKSGADSGAKYQRSMDKKLTGKNYWRARPIYKSDLMMCSLCGDLVQVCEVGVMIVKSVHGTPHLTLSPDSLCQDLYDIMPTMGGRFRRARA